MNAAGGGDAPEAVADGLHDALNLTYREQATKICVWIGKFVTCTCMYIYCMYVIQRTLQNVGAFQ